MRLWHAALFLLIACGGKIATESTTGAGQRPPQDDDDITGTSSSGTPVGSSSGVLIGTSSGTSGYGTSGYASSSGYYPGTTSGYPYPSSSSTSSGYPYPSSSSSSSGGYCSNVGTSCGADETNWKCTVGAGPTLACSGTYGKNVAHCSCYGDDAGGTAFDLPISSYDPQLLVEIWQKYCGGYCYQR